VAELARSSIDSSSTRLAQGVNGTSPNVSVLGKPARPLDFRLHRPRESQTEPLQNRRGDALAVADEPQQDVFGTYEIVAETARFFSSQNDDPSRSFGEPFKHRCLPPPSPDRAGFSCGDA
jgi:hypothetical protein